LGFSLIAVWPAPTGSGSAKKIRAAGRGLAAVVWLHPPDERGHRRSLQLLADRRESHRVRDRQTGRRCAIGGLFDWRWSRVECGAAPKSHKQAIRVCCYSLCFLCGEWVRAMSDQSDSDFASSNKIEKAGQDILQSLQKAADVAEASRETARRLSHQLQNAENRIAQLENRIRELEAEVELYKAKMERAKQWLRTLFSQIEERLFG
jgi:hypothetical protein